MKTQDEIKNTLKLCYTGICDTLAYRCPYWHEGNCTDIIMSDSLAYIEQLEERISLMKIQMRGDCGCCKHKAENGEPCISCSIDGDRPNWEYEGLPEIGK